MNSIELKWGRKETGILKIIADGIDTSIEINEESKDIKNIKSFFREILFKAYIKNEGTKIILNSSDIEIDEVKSLINDLIALCNDEMKLIVSND